MIATAFRKIASRLCGMASHPQSLNQRGVVLVAVLWICALIMWFAFQISAETRIQGEDQIHAIRYSQALHLATGGCYEALARIGMPTPLDNDRGSDLNWQPDGKPHVVSYMTGTALVIIESEEKKINVNRAAQVQLKQVIERAGADEVTAEQLADRILDFIDQDDIARLHGAEKDFYIKQGLNYIPFNGQLTSLDQLLLIPGMTQQIFYGYGRRPDQRTPEMPEILGDYLIPDKYSLFGMLTIYGNNKNLPQDFQNDQETDPQPLTWKSGGTYRILSFGKSANGPPAVGIWMTVRFSPGAQTPYTILSRKVL